MGELALVVMAATGVVILLVMLYGAVKGKLGAARERSRQSEERDEVRDRFERERDRPAGLDEL